MTGQPPSGGGNPFGWQAPSADADSTRMRIPAGFADSQSSPANPAGIGRPPVGTEASASTQPTPGRRDAARTSTADLDGGPQRVAAGRAAPDRAAQRRRTQRRRFLVVAAVVAVVLAIGTAALGFLLNPFEPEAAPVAIATPTTGPAVDGVVSGGRLTAGQCFAEYSSAWQDEFALADCTEPHAAQLYAIVTAVEFAADAAYPGETALRAEAMRACQAPTALNHAAAAEIDDLRIDAAYPMSQAEWDAGVRSYWCFASRESGEPLTSVLSLV